MQKVTASSLLLVLKKASERSLGLISTLILARLLTPDDFGVIAVAMLMLWFVENFSNAGTELYVLQKKNINTEELNSAWSLDLILKVISFILVLMFAGVLGFFLDKKDEAQVLFCIGFTLLFKALKNPGLWMLKREQSYSKIVKSSIVIKAISLCLTIPYAAIFKDFWAIVIGLLVSSFLEMVVSYRISFYRPVFNTLHFKEQWAFSKWLIPHEILGYFRHHLDTIAVSAKFPSSDLGAYNNLKYFSSIPLLQFLTPIVEPLHAELGKVQDNIAELKFQSDITILVMAFLATPIAVIFFTSSKVLVGVFLGAQWIEYHDIFSYFGLMVLPFVLLSQSNRLQMVFGRTRAIFFFEGITTFLTGLALVFIPIENISKFALIRVFIEIFVCSIFYFYVYRTSFGEFGLFNYFLVGIPFCCGVLVIYFFEFLIVYDYDIWKLVVNCLLSVLVVGLLFLIWYKRIGSHRQKTAILKYSPLRKGLK